MTGEEEVIDNNPFNINLDLLQDLGNETTFQEEPETELETEPEKELTEVNETEEPEEESGKEEEQEKEDPSSNKTEKSSPFTPFAKLAVEEGVLRNFDLNEWDGSPEGLVAGMNKEISFGINSYKESLNPRAKWLLDNMDEGVPLEALLQVDKQRVTLDNIKEDTLVEDEGLQKEILSQYYKETTKFTDEAIKKYIDRLETTGDLAEEAKSSFAELKQINVQKEQELQQQAAQQRELQIRQQQEALENFKNTLIKKEEIVPGVKLTDIMKETIEKTLTTPVDIDPNTGTPINEIAKARMEDPINFEINLAYVYKATKGFKDWSVFSSAGKKSAFKDFEDAVKNMDSSSGTKQRINKPDTDPDLRQQMEYFADFNKRY